MNAKKLAERRVFFPDGSMAAVDNEQAAETLTRGRAVIAEARAKYGIPSRATFTAQRTRWGVAVSGIRLPRPESPDDELQRCRAEVLEAKARMLGGR